MTNSKNGDKKEKIPYEPPRLFNLGGGVAHAAVQCNPGGSPAGLCKDGSMATSQQCLEGGVAGSNCHQGGVPQNNCVAGGTK